MAHFLFQPPNAPHGHERIPKIDGTIVKYNMTEVQAQRLARTIRTYWLNRGYDLIKVWVEHDPKVVAAGKALAPDREFGLDPNWTVRSNIVNGLPPARKIVDGYEKG